MDKLPDDRDAVVAEAHGWRRDVDAALGGRPGEERLRAMLPMLQLLDLQCHGLAPDLRGGICFEASSHCQRATTMAPAVAWHERGDAARRDAALANGVAETLPGMAREPRPNALARAAKSFLAARAVRPVAKPS